MSSRRASGSKDATKASKSGSASPKPRPTSSNEQRPGVKDFLVGAALGEGAYGQVFYVRHKVSKKDFAMKVMNKKQIMKEEKAHFVSMERRILSTTDNPHIMRLYYSFHDKTHLYMVIDICRGGDLRKLIDHWLVQNQGQHALPDSLARFYTAEIVAGMQHLHSRGIIHRDLKPENLLLTHDGHIKITDFGTAKDERSPPEAAKTAFVGTAEFVSPEVLRDREASVGADLWAMGCIIFQLVTGRTPFRDANEYLTFQRILSHPSQRLDYGEAKVNADAEDLIDKLLVRKPARRLGAAGNRTPFWKKTEATTSEQGEEDDVQSEVHSDDDDVEEEDDDFDSLSDHEAAAESASNGPDALRNHMYFNGMDFKSLSRMSAPELPYRTEFATPTIDGASGNWMVTDDATELRETGTTVKLDESSTSANKIGSDAPTPPGVTASLGKSNALAAFLSPDEKVLFDGLITKRRGMFSSPLTRHLVLTDHPRLFYLDPVKMVLKGEIPFSKRSDEMGLVVKASNPKSFDVSTPNRVYHLAVLIGNAQNWIKAIEGLQES